ncbi:hypothetical protein [Lysobacter gummosus]|uniref:hypothetical protein n=1 Tax=Lysobacter gummosus TaxID=262324 RepID=UPI00363343B9
MMTSSMVMGSVLWMEGAAPEAQCVVNPVTADWPAIGPVRTPSSGWCRQGPQA